MQTTSYFIWIELRAEFFSDVFVKIYEYIKKENIEDSIVLQNPLSPHITLYYLEKDLSEEDIISIKEDIATINSKQEIHLAWIDYFFHWEDKSVLYFTVWTSLTLKEYRNFFHNKYAKTNVENNRFEYSPHITILKILSSSTFEVHRINIETIIKEEQEKLKNQDTSTGGIYLYAVNSHFKPELQIKI